MKQFRKFIISMWLGMWLVGGKVVVSLKNWCTLAVSGPSFGFIENLCAVSRSESASEINVLEGKRLNFEKFQIYLKFIFIVWYLKLNEWVFLDIFYFEV